MPYRPEWDVDKAQGEAAELLVSRARTSIIAGTCEVKYDRRAAETGNVYIEFQCWWRDGEWHASGIAVTKAEAWAFVIEHTLIIVPVDVLRAVAREQFAAGQRELTTGSHPTKGVVVPLSVLVERSIALAHRADLKDAAA